VNFLTPISLALKDDSKLYFRDSVFKVQVKGIVLSKLTTSDVCMRKLLLPVLSPSQETQSLERR
ncbi:hypothetical protein, partial [Paenibacillus dendritiformis]|uniref:hypothetical protein n=1 Tax=Paenibacillus dendritiformis TaxID=130049 RepID=UPI001BCEDFBA